MKLVAPGSRFSSGTRTPVSVISACHTARSDPSPSIGLASWPGVPFSTSKPLSCPSITHPPPSRRAEGLRREVELHVHQPGGDRAHRRAAGAVDTVADDP
jgi:hypothetical protein